MSMLSEGLVEDLQVGQVLAGGVAAGAVPVAHEDLAAVGVDEDAVAAHQHVLVVVGGLEGKGPRGLGNALLDDRLVKVDDVVIDREAVLLEGGDGRVGLEGDALLGQDLAGHVVHGLHLVGREDVKLTRYVHADAPLWGWWLQKLRPSDDTLCLSCAHREAGRGAGMALAAPLRTQRGRPARQGLHDAVGWATLLPDNAVRIGLQRW